MKVKVYSGEFCPNCKLLKEWLKSNSIVFEDIDAQKNREAAMEMVELTGQRTIPVTIVEGHPPVIGFDKEKLKNILRI